MKTMPSMHRVVRLANAGSNAIARRAEFRADDDSRRRAFVTEVATDGSVTRHRERATCRAWQRYGRISPKEVPPGATQLPRPGR